MWLAKTAWYGVEVAVESAGSVVGVVVRRERLRRGGEPAVRFVVLVAAEYENRLLSLEPWLATVCCGD